MNPGTLHQFRPTNITPACKENIFKNFKGLHTCTSRTSLLALIYEFHFHHQLILFDTLIVYSGSNLQIAVILIFRGVQDEVIGLGFILEGALDLFTLLVEYHESVYQSVLTGVLLNVESGGRGEFNTINLAVDGTWEGQK